MKLDPSDKSFAKSSSQYKEMDKVNATGCSPFLIVFFGPYILYAVLVYWGQMVAHFGMFFGTIVFVGLAVVMVKLFWFFVRMKI